MKVEDFAKMDNPALAFYLAALADALLGVMNGNYFSIPEEVVNHAQILVEYFWAQLPEDGFSVTPSDWLE